MRDDFGEPFNGLVIPFGALVEHDAISTKDQSRFPQYGKKVSPGIFLGYAVTAGEFGKEISWSQTLRIWKTWTRQKSVLEESMQKKC